MYIFLSSHEGNLSAGSRSDRSSDQRALTASGESANAGQFHWLHQIVSDSDGDLYTGEVDTGKRIQKFVLLDRRKSQK